MDFDQIKEVVAPHSELESPSFIQGMLIGLLCGDNDIQEAVWIKKLIEEANIKSVKESFLQGLDELFNETNKGLNGSGFELELCLPDDSDALGYRAMMIGQLCEGVLYGLGLIGCLQDAENEIAPEVRELINDFTEIASIDVDGIGQEEAEKEALESSLMELTEFVKIGIMTINESLNPADAVPIPMDGMNVDMDDDNDTLH
ncbi:MAG: YecA family protein [Gammaproteobacteria bacterium]|nr:YecA family protein [Gammaproteobacteria bacterium]